VHHGKDCALMSQMGQERRIGAVRNISALPPRADVGADIVEPPVSAISGCEQSQHRGVYSITSSARASSAEGTSMPSALAVGKLITSSNLVGSWIGRSPGFSPLRMRPA
jgi:hypothetical protein